MTSTQWRNASSARATARPARLRAQQHAATAAAGLSTSGSRVPPERHRRLEAASRSNGPERHRDVVRPRRSRRNSPRVLRIERRRRRHRRDTCRRIDLRSASAEPQSKTPGTAGAAQQVDRSRRSSEREQQSASNAIHVRSGMLPAPDHAQALKSRRWARVLGGYRGTWRGRPQVELVADLPYFFSTTSSIGRPWQSQPGM